MTHAKIHNIQAERVTDAKASKEDVTGEFEEQGRGSCGLHGENRREELGVEARSGQEG